MPIPIITASNIPRSSFTLADLRSAIYGDLNYTANIVILDSDITRWGREASDRIALESRWYRVSAQITVVSGIAEYEAPSGAIAVKEAWLDGKRLQEIAAGDLWANSRTAVGGAVSSYYVQGETLVGLAPTPMAAGGLTLYLEALPPPAGSDTDRFWIPTGLEDAIKCYCRLRASQKDAFGEGGQRIEGLEAEWQQWLARSRGYVEAFAERELLALGESGLSRLRGAIYGDLDYSREVGIADRDLRRWGKEAQDRLALESRWYRISSTVALQAGTAEYALPSGSIGVREVWLAGVRLRDVSADELWGYNRNGLTGGTPLAYYVNGESQLGLIPTPGASGTLTLYIESLPPVPDDSTDFKTPAGLEAAIVCFCKLRAAQKDPAMAPRVPLLEAEWLQWLSRASSYVTDYAEEEIVSAGSDARGGRRGGPLVFPLGGQTFPVRSG